jgi:hypothetical protein
MDGWRALQARGLSHLSPPEVEHALLELAANRIEYTATLKDIGDYPRRSPLGSRLPQAAEIEALRRRGGRWRTVTLLDDERALCIASTLFHSAFLLDPLYDTGMLLYGAWHDPAIREDHVRHLAEQAALVVRAGPLLENQAAFLAPDHLPGSWSPRADWRKPRPTADQRQHSGWAMRTGLVLLYWADRLNAAVCTSRPDIIGALDTILGERAAVASIDVSEPSHVADACAARMKSVTDAEHRWTTAWRASRRRRDSTLDEIAVTLMQLAAASSRSSARGAWQLWLAGGSIPEPALLARRVLWGQDPRRQPALPRKRLRRRPLLLLPRRGAQGEASRASAAPIHTPMKPSTLVPST